MLEKKLQTKATARNAPVLKLSGNSRNAVNKKLPGTGQNIKNRILQEKNNIKLSKKGLKNLLETDSENIENVDINNVSGHNSEKIHKIPEENVKNNEGNGTEMSRPGENDNKVGSSNMTAVLKDSIKQNIPETDVVGENKTKVETETSSKLLEATVMIPSNEGCNEHIPSTDERICKIVDILKNFDKTISPLLPDKKPREVTPQDLEFADIIKSTKHLLQLSEQVITKLEHLGTIMPSDEVAAT